MKVFSEPTAKRRGVWLALVLAFGAPPSIAGVPLPAATASATLIPTVSSAPAQSTDLYAGIKTYRLPNGLTVLLVSSANTGKVGVQVLVSAGMNEEKDYGEGVAHLTEHSVFRDPHLGAESYLDILRRDGASDLNAITTADMTVFHASVPSAQGAWLVGKFGELFQKREFDPSSVEKCKEEIALELATRSALSEEKSLPQQLLPILKQEFGVSSAAPLTNAELSRVSRLTRRLTQSQVKSFFDRYYIPANMVLTVVGSFAEAPMAALIEGVFGKVPRSSAGPRVEPPPVPRTKPFFVSYPSMNAYIIQLGTKFWELTAQNELILRAYMEDLALRLMQTLRSASAQTYTVSPFTYLDTRRFGFSIIAFETMREKYADNYSYVTDLVDSETLDGRLSDADIARIRKLYMQHFLVIDPDVKGLTEAANRLYDFQRTYHTSETPYSVFQRITNNDFRRGLAQLFDPERRYTLLLEPPIFFKYEWPLLSLVALLYSFFLMRTLYRREINESSGIRYTEKFRYSLLTMLLLSLGVLILLSMLGTIHIALRAVEADWFNFRGAFVLSYYAQGVILSCLTLCSIIYYRSLIPRRILIDNRHIVVKSLAFRAWIFPLDAIKRVETCTTLKALFRRGKKVRIVHYGVFKKGVWIEVRNGTAFFVGFRSPEKAASAIRAACGQTAPEEESTGTFSAKKSA